MNYSDFLLTYARNGLFGSLKKSAFRKFCRLNSGRSFVARCRSGFAMNTTIGDSVDNQIYVHGVLEKGTTHIVENLAPHCESFIDVGCNIGYYSCLFGVKNPGRPLLAIDPNPIMIARTEENLKLNRITGYRMLNCGVGKESATMKFNIPRYRHSLSSFAFVPRKGGPVDTIDARITTLDTILAEHAIAGGLVKIDTEGFEFAVFCGLSDKMIDSIRFIVFEMSGAHLIKAGSSPSDLLSLPVMKNFDMYVARNEEGGFIEKADSTELDQDDVSANVLLVRRNDEAIKAFYGSSLRRR